MQIELWGFGDNLHVGLPQRTSGLILLTLELLALILILFIQRRSTGGAKHGSPRLGLRYFSVLLLLAPIGAEVLSIRLGRPIGLPWPSTPGTPQGWNVSLLGTLCWMLAAAWFGLPESLAVAIAFGATRGGWETHSLLEPLHTALQAAVFTAFLRLDWEGSVGRLLRNPVVAGSLAGILGGVLHTVDLHGSSLGTSFDATVFALSWLPAALGAGVLEGGLSGSAAFGLASALRLPWSRPEALGPSPLGSRRLGGPLAWIVVSTLVVMAGFVWSETRGIRTAIETELTDRMSPLAKQTAAELQVFIQTGRGLVSRLADVVESRLSSDPAGLGEQSMPMAQAFFDGAAVLDGQGEVLLEQPPGWLSSLPDTREVSQRWTLALKGIASELSLPSGTTGHGASILFFTPIIQAGQTSPVGAVAGEADIGATPVLALLADQADSPAYGDVFVADLEGAILWPVEVPELSPLQIPTEESLDSGIRIAADGTLSLVHVEDLKGYPWRVLVTVPLEAVLGGRVASTGRGILALAVAGAASALLQWVIAGRRSIGLKRVAAELATMARGAGESSSRHELLYDVTDLLPLIRRLEAAMEGHRRDIDVGAEIDRRIASGRELREILPEVLEILRSSAGADLARIVLSSEPAHLLGIPPSFQSGSDPGGWNRLDGEILSLSSESGQLILENPSRARPILDTLSLSQPIQALLAQSLKSGGSPQGVIWFGYLAPRAIPPSEVIRVGGFVERVSDAIAKAYRQRRAEAERLQAMLILDSIPDPVVLTTQAGDVIFANPPAEKLLNESREPEEARAEGMRQAPRRPGASTTLSDKGDIRSGEGKVFRPQIFDVGSRIERREYRLYVLRDLSEQDSDDRLRTSLAAATGLEAKTTLEQLLAYGRMLSAVGTISEQQVELIRKSQDSGHVLDQLLEDLLLIGGSPIRSLPMRERIELGTLLSEILAAHGPLARNRQVRLAVDQSEPAPTLEGNRLLIRQAVSTLARNAILSTPGGGSVTLSARAAGVEVRIVVADTGHGIAPADMERILRGRESDREGEPTDKGTGPGIRMARDVAARHGGTLTAESRLGVGTKIELQLPSHQS